MFSREATVLTSKLVVFLIVPAGKELGETVLYFGCRHKNEDYIYQEELEEAEKTGVLSQLHVAFSRDQEQKVGLGLLPHGWKAKGLGSCT